jgi:SAM-dependent methyltransferase
MKKKLSEYGQYKHDIFAKLNFNFTPKSKILNLGCGDGEDSVILRDFYDLNVSNCDIYRHENIDKFKLDFDLAGIYDLPYKSESFDYIFLHDVLHHIDEETQNYDKHIAGLTEAIRVLKPGGKVIIVEGNRYNPLFYPHMVKMLGHEHFKQSYFKKIINDSYKNYEIQFNFFECHAYPKYQVWFWKIFEYIMEKFVPAQFLAYNIAIITKK